jgi:hypothetical protein
MRTRCVEDALRQIPPQETVTVICRDGSQARGEILGFDATQGAVRLLPDGARRPGRANVWFTPADSRYEPRTLPAADVMRLEWRESGGSGVGGAFVGLLLGGLLGCALGDATAPEPEYWLDFRDIEHTVAITALGGFVGLTLGYIVGSHSRVMRTIDCPDGAYVAAEQ